MDASMADARQQIDRSGHRLKIEISLKKTGENNLP
jgi:hypothetical protein